MAANSAFDKRYVDPKDQSNVEGLLEHFNLPPKLITFLRENKRMVQAVIVLVVVAIVSYSMWQSYTENRLEKSASSLALALKEPESGKMEALQRVADEYSSTPSGIWAKVEIAHQLMKDKDFTAASNQYSEVNSSVKEGNPLFALTLVGVAQAEEAQEKYDSAYGYYESLSMIEGYQLTGYQGMARIHETQGEFDKALGIYGQYLAVLGDDPAKSGEKAVVEGIISRIKAIQ